MENPRFLLSSDLNGTLVYQHTMSEMIRKYLGEEKFAEADKIFKAQMAGQATMREAFRVAGELTRGLTLRQAIEYTLDLKYIAGFDQFAQFLCQRQIPLVINSTGYSVTVYSIMEYFKKKSMHFIHGFIGNILLFGKPYGNYFITFSEAEINRLIHDYFFRYTPPYLPNSYNNAASGDIELGLKNEDAKAEKIFNYAAKHFPGLPASCIIHMGDTFGDSGGIVEVAKAGGIGIAFNYTQNLKNFLDKELVKGDISGRIYFIDPKESGNADLRHIIDFLMHMVM